MSARSALVRQLPCIACEIQKCDQPYPTEEHHQNLDGHAGQKRLGDDYSVPLCKWHHRGVCQPIGPEAMRLFYGPSLARESKAFRQRYGSDEKLLEMTNERLREVA